MTAEQLLKEKNILFRARTVSGSGTSDPVIFGEKVFNISCELFFLTASTAKVQATLSSESAVVSGVAEWDDWPDGDVTVKTTKSADAPTAVRVVNSGTGDVVLNVRCNRGSN